MARLRLTRVGEDSWNRMTYEDTNGNFYKDIDIFSDETPTTLYTSSPSKDFDGEPDCPISDFEITNPLTEREIREGKYRTQYAMLSRLKMDCAYFLGYGGRCERHLWAGNVADHIAEMKKLWQGFPDDIKPEWCTWGQILEYERKMAE